MRFYGRTQSHLSIKNQNILDNDLPNFAVANFEDFYNFYKKNSFSRIALEIGFGFGDFLSEVVVKNPDTLYLGVEVFSNGVASLVEKVLPYGVSNLKIYHGSAYDILEVISESVLDNIYILFPDPWPKVRHHKRRIINSFNLDIFAKILKPNSVLRFVTDIEDYAKWSIQLLQEKEWELTTDSLYNVHKPPQDHIVTRYQKKAYHKNNKIFYIEAINKK